MTTIDNFTQVAMSKPRAGDLVYLSRDGGFPWKVEHTNADDNTIYVKSVIGGRHAQVTVNQVVAQWRDEKAATPTNHRENYNVDGPWEDEA